MSEKVRLQRLLNFTTHIIHIIDDGDGNLGEKRRSIAGTGFVISPEWLIATCAHVVKIATDEQNIRNGLKVIVYIPGNNIGESAIEIDAEVVKSFRDNEDDIVLLKPIKAPHILEKGNYAELGNAEDSQSNRFSGLGYQPANPQIPWGYIEGTIGGPLPAPPERKLHALPIELKTSNINHGMSGSPILDLDLNRVVGVVTENYFDEKGQSTGKALAINCQVIEYMSNGPATNKGAYPLNSAEKPKIDVESARKSVAAKKLGTLWNNAPSLPDEWIVRKNILKDLTDDWRNPKRRVTEIIGLAGEGKTSLVRNWIEGLLRNEYPDVPETDGVFWWSFDTMFSVDTFFESALKFMSHSLIDPTKVRSADVRAQIIGAMLGAGSYIFVLDGLDSMQYERGDKYGRLVSAALREFLKLFCTPDHNSFCVITSRIPIFDLIEYTTYNHREINGLTNDEGIELLKKLGVKESQKLILSDLVKERNGHVLTLILLGKQIVESQNNPSIDDQGFLEMDTIDDVLRRYEPSLSETDKFILMLLCTFRSPVNWNLFKEFIVLNINKINHNHSLLHIDINDLDNVEKNLFKSEMIRFDQQTKEITFHKLIQEYYYSILNKNSIQKRSAHALIKDYYLSIAGRKIPQPSLGNLKPLIEAVYHACCAEEYDFAWRIYTERLNAPKDYLITVQLGAYDTVLSLTRDFFPEGDFSKEPFLKNPLWKSRIFATVGFCLMSLGQLHESERFYLRQIAISKKINQWQMVSNGYQNLSRLNIHFGRLGQAQVYAASGTDAAEIFSSQKRKKGPINRQKSKTKRNSLCWLGYTYHLAGELKKSSNMFNEAQNLHRNIYGKHSYLDGLRGIQHAEHLIRIDETELAKTIVASCLNFCEKETHQMSRCYRLLGIIEAAGSHHDLAGNYFELAVEKARAVFRQDVLITALFARGLWLSKSMNDATPAFKDLNEALDYAVAGGFKIYEADIHVALAWAHLIEGHKSESKKSANLAQQISNDMGYYWGKIDAIEVLSKSS
jgi:tetratricopeptide (TPR) repeat protein/GTPase SAR1 family protein